MRHGKKFNHLSRTSAHRKALLKNLSISLIEHKRINTTLAKARALRRYIEPLVTKAKKNNMHSRRVVFSYLQNNGAINELFGAVVNKIGDRPGGYTRIIKTGFRQGDNAEMAMIEFVDFNEVLLAAAASGKASSGAKKGRTRRGRKKGSSPATPPADVATNELEETMVEDSDQPTATGEEE